MDSLDTEDDNSFNPYESTRSIDFSVSMDISPIIDVSEIFPDLISVDDTFVDSILLEDTSGMP